MNNAEEAFNIKQHETDVKEGVYQWALKHPTILNPETAKEQWMAAAEESNGAYSDYIQSYIEYQNLLFEQFEAGQNQFVNAQSLLQNKLDANKSQYSLDEALGIDSRTFDNIEEDIALSSELITSLQNQIDDLDNNRTGMDPYEYSKRRVELNNQIKTINEEIVGLIKESAESSVKLTEKEYENIKNTSDETDRLI